MGINVGLCPNPAGCCRRPELAASVLSRACVIQTSCVLATCCGDPRVLAEARRKNAAKLAKLAKRKPAGGTLLATGGSRGKAARSLAPDLRRLLQLDEG